MVHAAAYPGGRGEGGGRARAPPHWFVKYSKSHVFGAFEADFWWKIKNSPPKEIGCRSCEVDVVMRYKKAFEFRSLAEKPVSISAKTFFLFFLEITCFWAEKTFEFPSFPRNSVSIFGQTEWYWLKTKKNSGQGRLYFSHSFKKAPPPFPNPGYAPGYTTFIWNVLHIFYVFSCLWVS